MEELLDIEDLQKMTLAAGPMRVPARRKSISGPASLASTCRGSVPSGKTSMDKGPLYSGSC
jgi:hypothetical protein